MKVTMMLADAAQAVSGKLYILGGGWSITGPDPVPFALAIKIEVPWLDANQKHRFEITLFDADGQPVRIADQPIQIGGDFEAGRPAGLPVGTPLDATFAINMAPLPLPAGSRFVWRLSINGESHDDWTVGFITRPARQGAPQKLG